MTIRRKLFFAFLATVAVPLVILLWCALAYLHRTRGDLDRRFVEQAMSTLKALDRSEGDGEEQLVATVRTLASDPAMRALDREALPGVVDHFRHRHPEIVGVRVERTSGEVVFGSGPDLTGLVGLVRTTKADLMTISDEDRDRQRRGEGERRVELRFGDSGLNKGGPPVSMTGVRISEKGVPVGLLLAVLDERYGAHPQHLFETGVAFRLLTEGPGKLAPFHEPLDADELWKRMPPAALLEKLGRSGEAAAVFRGDGGNLYRLFARPRGVRSTEPQRYWGSIVVVPEAEVYSALLRIQFGVGIGVALSILVAVGLAWLFSYRLVGAVENIKQGVRAISRGEWAHLEKSSHDELGGELVESVNRMASTLAERTRKEEIQNWRRLVRVLSHEINNTLGPIRSVAATIHDRIIARVGDEDASKDLKMASRLIVERVDALSGFIAGYSDLAKLPEPERQRVDFNKLVASAAHMFEEEAARRKVRLRADYDTRLDGAQVDPGQMERVVINLLKNALEAAPTPGGQVLVRTFRPGRGRLELAVEDDGPGIAPDARKNLFVPYFTTKPGGTGIGLALVRQIVLGHGGLVTAEDRAGGGTVLRVVLPESGGEIT